MSTKYMDCPSCTVSSCIIKKYSQLEIIQPYLKQKKSFSCRTGQQFVLEGSPVNGLYFIYSGNVKVYKHTANTDSQIIRFSKEGEIVGHRGFGTNYVYDISASTLSETVLCNFQTSVLIEMLHLVPPLMFDFMLFYADQLQKSEANAIRFAQMSVKEKVMNGLLFIYKKFGQTDFRFNIQFSRKDIADFAGTSTDQVIRVISALKKDGLLCTEGKSIGITDLPTFEAMLNDTHYFLEG
jgi:CRP-like cAMP-binding protein